jgi:catechol 2,3-dioxygenase-like lactoylglutathione lyase family enzyme
MKTQNIAPVFPVSNLDTALKYYKDVLGFTEDFRFGHYAGVKLGAVTLHLSAADDHPRPVGGSIVYIFCDAVDDYYGEIKGKEALVVFEPKNWPYGMRDFRVQDIDGNYLSLGCELPDA